MLHCEGNNDAVLGPLGTLLSLPVQVAGEVGRRVKPIPTISAGAISGNRRTNHGKAV